MMSKGYLLLSFNLVALIKLMRWMWSQCPVPNLGTGYTRPQYSSLKVENAKKLQVRQDDRINISHSGLMGIILFIWSSYTTNWTPLDGCHWPLFFKTKHQGSKMHQSWRPGARMAEIELSLRHTFLPKKALEDFGGGFHLESAQSRPRPTESFCSQNLLT